MKIKTLLFILLILVPAGSANAQQAEIERTYEVFIPTTYDENEALPLLIALHGAGGTGTWMQGITGFDAIAEEEDFVVVYPDGIGNDWDFGFGVQTEDGIIQVDDIAFVAGLIDKVAATVNIDTERVYLTGYSNGATLAYMLACQRPELFAGVAAVAAPLAVFIGDNCSEVPISMLLIHGTDDPILSWEATISRTGTLVVYSASDTFMFWGQHNGCSLDDYATEELPDVDTEDGSIVRTVSFSGCTDDTQVKIYGIDGGGHTWAGHLIEAPFQLGATNMDIDASQEIWAWFAGLDQG